MGSQTLQCPLRRRRRVGGLPLLRAGEPWPECRSRREELTFILQLGCAALPVETSDVVRLVQLLYCTGGPDCGVTYGDDRAASASPPGARHPIAPSSCTGP